MVKALLLSLVMSIYWPGDGFQKGHGSSSGHRLNASELTCAHKKWPFGTLVKLAYGSRSVVARIVDRGPFKRGRDIDCMPAVAHALHFPGLGHVRAELQ